MGSPALVAVLLVPALVWLLVLVQWMSAREGRCPGLVHGLIWSVGITAATLIVLGRLGHVTVEVRGAGIAAGLLAMVSVVVVLVGLGAKERRPGRNAITKLLLLDALLLGVSLVVHGGPFSQGTVSPIAALTFLPGIAVACIYSGITREAVMLSVGRLTSLLVYLSVLLAFVSPDWVYDYRDSNERRYQIFDWTQRLPGLTPHPNLLGITALLACLVAISLRRPLWWLTTAVSVFAIVMAESRVAAVSLASALLIAWILRRRSKVAATIGVAPLVLLGFAAIRSALTDPSTSGLTSDLSTLNGRETIWNVVLDHWHDHPLLGFGPLAFNTHEVSIFTLTGYPHAHNQVLEGLVEGGLPGAVLMVCLLGAICAAGWRHRGDWLIPGVVVAVLLQSVTETFLSPEVFGFNYAALPAVLVVALLVSADSAAPDATAEHSEGRELELTGGNVAKA